MIIQSFSGVFNIFNSLLNKTVAAAAVFAAFVTIQAFKRFFAVMVGGLLQNYIFADNAAILFKGE